MQQSSLPYFSKCPPVDIFLASLSISHATHILQKMCKGNKSKTTAIVTYLRRQPFHYVTFACFSYLNYFLIFSQCGWLSHIHTSKLQYNCISHFKKKKTAVEPSLQFLRKLKTSRDQCLGPKILVTHPVTLVILATHFAWIPYDHTPVIHSTGSYLE